MIWKVVKRGARGRCPHCGVGPLFVRWITSHERCPHCGLLYRRNQGDTWLFWIIGDRIPIALGIIVLYFGFRTTSYPLLVGFFLFMVIPLVWTMPQRLGIAIALDYLSRVYLPDPSDEMPEISGSNSASSGA